MIDGTSRQKMSMIRRCLPVKSVIDYGGMWAVDGYYSRQCAKSLGIHKVTMIDKFESESWKQNSKLREGIDFRLGDFADASFMKTIKGQYDLALAYDILPHQIELRQTLSLVLSKTRSFFLVCNAVLPDRLMPFRNSLILLSGSNEPRLIPFHEKWTREKDYWRNFSNASITKSIHWIWGMTPSFIESLMTGLGWRLMHKQFWRTWLPKESSRQYCGLIFRKAK